MTTSRDLDIDSSPVQSNSWSVEFEFKIDGKNSHVFGDGFAFWFVVDKYKEGEE